MGRRGTLPGGWGEATGREALLGVAPKTLVERQFLYYAAAGACLLLRANLLFFPDTTTRVHLA